MTTEATTDGGNPCAACREAEIMHILRNSHKTRGVKATTIKLIASAARCTNSALYYYFEGGKTQILEEALRGILSERIKTFEQLDTDLPYGDFLRQIGELASRDFGTVTDHISWLLVEFSNLPTGLQAEFHQYIERGHGVLASAFTRHLDDPAELRRSPGCFTAPSSAINRCLENSVWPTALISVPPISLRLWPVNSQPISRQLEQSMNRLMSIPPQRHTSSSRQTREEDC